MWGLGAADGRHVPEGVRQGADWRDGLLEEHQWEGEEDAGVRPPGTCTADPRDNPHLNVNKIAKNLSFFSKNCQKIFIFSPTAIFKKIFFLLFFWKKTIFGNFFEKNDKFLAIFCQSNSYFPEGQVSRQNVTLLDG